MIYWGARVRARGSWPEVRRAPATVVVSACVRTANILRPFSPLCINNSLAYGAVLTDTSFTSEKFPNNKLGADLLNQ